MLAGNSAKDGLGASRRVAMRSFPKLTKAVGSHQLCDPIRDKDESIPLLDRMIADPNDLRDGGAHSKEVVKLLTLVSFCLRQTRHDTIPNEEDVRVPYLEHMNPMFMDPSHRSRARRSTRALSANFPVNLREQ